MKKEKKKKTELEEYKNWMPLPNNSWLIANGHSGLVECMKTHPEIFKDIRQDKETD